MIITSVVRAKKHCHKIITDECEFLLSNDTLCEYPLKPGVTLTPKQVEQLKLHSDCKRALSKGSWLLSDRDYTEKGMHEKLSPDYCSYAVEFAIAQLKSVGAIDDSRYAENAARYLCEYKNLSKKGIISELIKRGVDREIAEVVTQTLEYNPTKAAAKIIRQKYRNYGDDEKIRRRMINALQRKGFSFREINDAIDYINEGDEDEM